MNMLSSSTKAILLLAGLLAMAAKPGQEQAGLPEFAERPATALSISPGPTLLGSSIDCSGDFDTTRLVSWGTTGSTACWQGSSGGDLNCNHNGEVGCAYSVETTQGTVHSFSSPCNSSLKVDIKGGGARVVITGGADCSETTT